MNKIHSYRPLISFMAISAMAITGCSKWTEPQSIGYDDGYGEPSAEYLASLRSFKASDHKVSIVTMPATSGQPVSQCQHIMAMPDSADYICITDIKSGLFPSIAAEMSEVREKKGTEVICDIDYMLISDEWQAMEENKEDGQDAGSEEEFRAFVSSRTREQLACCDRYDFSGIMVSYLGNNKGFGRFGQEEFVKAVREWKSSNPDKIMIFSGNAMNINDQEIFGDCRYIVVPGKNDYSAEMLAGTMDSYCRYLENNDDKKKIIMETHVPCDLYPLHESAKVPQPVAAAEWALEPDDTYGRCGVCIANSQDDYLVSGTFSVIRRAIAVMNGGKDKTE